MAFPVNPSVCNVLNEESQEQASHQDSTSSCLVFDAFEAVVVEEQLCVGEKLSYVSINIQ